MKLPELDFDYAYETLESDPVEGFYVPALGASIRYDRIAGFFTSASLALAARGIAGLIGNGGHMRLIVSPRLNPEDVRVIRESTESPQWYIEECMMCELETIEDSLEADHVRALGWMLANGLLDMRIACVIDDEEEATGALFHQKVGIMEDSEGNRLSFSGSVNETATGWLFNSEEFKVFRDWTDGEGKYLEADAKKFEDFWNGSRKHVRVYEPTEAFRNGIVHLADGFEIERIAVTNYKKEKARLRAKESISLFDYQRAALDYWDSHGRRLLFEMATGTGKTRTAIACVNLVMRTEKLLVCIVAAPEVTLARQWEAEFSTLGVDFDEKIYADSSSGGKAKWKPEIARCLSRLVIGRCKSILIMTTHDTASAMDFTACFEGLTDKARICFVGDEVHGLGAVKRRMALLDRYDYRIGLSATPARWFDDEGTALLARYFGNDSFVFGIREALSTINPLTGETTLTPYVYRLEFLQLDSDEMEDYLEISEKIAKLMFAANEDMVERKEMLMFKRANMIKNAAAKMPLFRRIVRTESMDKTLIFVSPQQIGGVCEILAAEGIAAHPFTMNQGTKKSAEYGGMSEREHIIKCFKEGWLQTLVAISCLDEGIDIPCAEKGILLASSTNPREYIQRIGRVIRRFPGKQSAEIVDLVVEPDWTRFLDPETRKSEAKIFAKELNRVKDIAENSLNSTEVLFQINGRLERIYGL